MNKLDDNGIFRIGQLAVIKRGRAEGDWVLIPVDEGVQCYVNGTPVKLMYHLQENDVITFDGDENSTVVFTTHNGSFGEEPAREVVPKKKTPWWLAFAAALIVVAVFLFFGQGKGTGSKLDASSLESSVLKIRVDSVQLVRTSPAGEKEILGSYNYAGSGEAPTGTAFLTKDSSLVTARHCIEPWLNSPLLLRGEYNSPELTDPEKWSLQAETHNQLHNGGETLCLVSYISLLGGQKGNTPVFCTNSVAFRYDSSKDDIVPMGSYAEEYYWRSVAARGSRRSMMLGDIACLPKCGFAGKIELPAAEKLKCLASEGSFTAIGYPCIKDPGQAKAAVELSRSFDPAQMMVLSGNVSRGYSGGPVLAAQGGVAYAVAVVSIADSSDNIFVYAVPVSAL